MAVHNVLTYPPHDPMERSLWCQQQLAERRRCILSNQHITIVNKIKQSVRRRRRYPANNAQIHDTQRGNIRKKIIIKKSKVEMNTSKRPDKIQVFLYSDFSGPIRFVGMKTDQVSSIIKFISMTFNLPASKIRLATGTNFQLCEVLSLDDHGIDADTNIYVTIEESGLKGGADSEDAIKKKTDESKGDDDASNDNIHRWRKEDVRHWLINTVRMQSKYANMFYEEEVDGETLITYKEKDLLEDFKIKDGPLTKLLGYRDNLQIKVPPITFQDLPANLEEWTPNHVELWAKSINLDDKYIQVFKDEEYDGDALRFLTPEKIQRIFSMRKGPMRKLLYRIYAIADTLVDGRKQLTSESQMGYSTSAMSQGPRKFPHTSSDKDTKSAINKAQPQTFNDVKTKEKQFTYAEKHHDPDVLQCIELLNRQLELDLYKKADVSEYYPCTLQLISGVFGKAANLLERQFCFLTLKKGQKELTSQETDLLWKQIQLNVKQFIRLLPANKQVIFDVNIETKGEGVARASDKQQFLLRDKGLAACPMLRKNLKSITMHTQLVLLVDSKMLTPTTLRYGTYLDIKNDDVVFFNFDENKRYATSFDCTKNMTITFPQRRTRAAKIEEQRMSDKICVGSLQSSLKHLPDRSSPGNMVKEDLFTMKSQTQETETRVAKEGLDTQDINSTQSHQVKASLMQKPRLFDREVENCSYTKGWILDIIETGVIDILQPVHEYKQFTSYARSNPKERIWKFVTETIRFAAACLNDRTNGTIHFGIADSKHGYAQHGQIYGIEVLDKPEYEEGLDQFIGKCFQKNENIECARKCIRPPRYVPVSAPGITRSKYVIEVDIVPHSTICKNKAFFVRLPANPEKQRLQNISKTKETLFRRIGSTSSCVEGQELHTFLETHLHVLVKQRKEAEQSTLINVQNISMRRDRLARKLQWLLCTGGTTLDSSFYPILVLNKPHSYVDMESELRFVNEINWIAVFDFDPESQLKGICAFHSQNRVSNIQDPDMYLNITDVCARRDEIGFPEKTCWVFCNGRTAIDERPFTNKLEWNVGRSKGVKEAIRFFANEDVIPKGRAIVVFLILSQQYEIMVETFGEFSTYFTSERLMCIADDDSICHGWAREITERFCSMELLQERSVIGMPWSHVNATILRMKGITDNDSSSIPCSTGAQVVLKKRDRELLNDIEVLSSNQCENQTNTMSREEFKEFQREKELKFYQGHQVDWWNFWATDNHYNHVLIRDRHYDLRKYVQDALSPDISTEVERIVTISLFHQPGAGGTTMARNVLWELRKQYRCAVVCRVTANTANQLIRLWTYKEIGFKLCTPIVVVVEELDEAVFRELLIQIDDVCTKKGIINIRRPVCVMIHCKRYIYNDPTVKRQMQLDSVTLKHELTENERTWFVNKLEQLETNYTSLDEIESKHLISFMILKENFNKNYVEKMVKGILAEIPEGYEAQLLKYVALLNTYVIDSSIAVACCDSLMGIGFYRLKKKENQHSEFLLSPPMKLLLLEMQKISIGSVKAYKIVHPLVANEILKQLQTRDNQGLGDATLEFLRSKLFQTNSHAKEDLRHMTTEMLKRRKKFEYGDDYETKFSPLIMDVLEVDGPEKATQVLLVAMDLFKEDTMVIQQVARMYLYRKEFEDAKQFAEKALSIKPGNSFLLDTLGEVYKEQMSSDYLHVKVSQKKMKAEEMKRALKLAFSAMDIFHRSQVASTKERFHYNIAGYKKEIETCFRLLEILLCVEGFHKSQTGIEALHRYLVETDFTPVTIRDPWTDFHSKLKGLSYNVDLAIQWITDYCTYYKEEHFYDYASIQKLKGNLYDYNSKYSFYFGERRPEPPSTMQDVESVNEWRRRRVSTLGCSNFRNVFYLIQKIKKKPDIKGEIIATLRECRKLLLMNEPKTTFDLLCLISLNLALSSVDATQTGVSSLNTILEYSQQYLQMNKKGQLYPYFFLSMILWPRADMGVPYDEQTFQLSLRDLKDQYSAKEKQRREPMHKWN
uniref:Sterile alpha motif domain-containing protein 9-like n=1 Tax=Saccoglossus kowalevskii TaxID=10224 RepID=A0ABM0N018_SACKO|nr:PREDICTED: sterile alpha motif domain-containing protein 9-like [Saccoglossus kowalevskii]